MRSEGLDQSKVGETSQQPSAEKSVKTPQPVVAGGGWLSLA